VSKKSLLITGAALVLCLLVVIPVFAQGAGGNPVYATIVYVDELREYVDQKVADLYEYIDDTVAAVYTYVDEQIAGIGGGGGEDFDLPPAEEEWWGLYEEESGAPAVLSLSPEPANCTYHGGDVGQYVLARAHASGVGSEGQEAYGVGNCKHLIFRPFPVLDGYDEFDVQVSFWWMETTTEGNLHMTCGPKVGDEYYKEVICTGQAVGG